MSKIIACIDGSKYADSVSELASWAVNRTNLPLSLIHVVTPHADVEAKVNLSGAIGLGAKTDLLNELTRIDEEHGKLEQKKGQLILQHAKEELSDRGIQNPDILHRRGSLVETIAELEKDAELIIIGKRGENAHNDTTHLGSILERVARSVHTPLLVSTESMKPIQSFLIAYDGSTISELVIEYVKNATLLKGLSCHIVSVAENNPENKTRLHKAASSLKEAQFNVHSELLQSKLVEEAITEYIVQHAITLLVIGAYDHSKLRSFILGSSTTSLIRESQIPVLLFR
jgi:nucleotide-binding universal stress UspA family protein